MVRGRKRGQDAACKAAVHACVDVGKEIRRQAEDIATDLDPMPRLDLKVGTATVIVQPARSNHRQLCAVSVLSSNIDRGAVL